jgi:Ca-activated chloride channel homolog
VAQFLGDIETAVVHYGSSTGFFGRKMFAGGPQYLSAAVLYENMVIESYAETGLPFPVVAIYPKEGSFWSDHPVGIVDREWVTEEHREAAEKYIEFLTAQPQQKRAMEFGFRPAEVSIALGAPIDEAHGVNPQEPQTTLEVPSAQVARAVVDLWKKHKKHSNIILVLDTSGSMKGEKIANAKEGGGQFIAMLGDEDVISLLPFNNQARFAGERLKLRSDRAQAKNLIDSYFADGGTSLYDAISMAYRQLMDNPAPGMISAIVVLSDGKDTDSSMKIDELLEQIDSDDEQSSAIRIFTIAYGNEANTGVLQQISNATNAKSFEGHPDNIREVFKEISTFF